MDFLRYYTDDSGRSRCCFSNEEEATHAVVPIEEYHGLLKAVRIVRERALQQIDKAKADEHGYTLLRASRKPFKVKQGGVEKHIDSWRVTLSSPYSIKMPLSVASTMLRRDLTDFYGFHDLTQEELGCMMSAFNSIFGDEKSRDRRPYLMDKPTVAVWYDELAACAYQLPFRIVEVSKNAAQGCYEVTYLTTSIEPKHI